MKTTNNAQKTILKTLAVLFSLVLLTYTVSAQNFWRNLLLDTSFNEIAIALVETQETNFSDAEATTYSKGTSTFEYAEEAEESLSLEEWMLNENTFNTFEILETEVDNSLELESWMTNDASFEVATFSIEEESDEALNLEDWMIEESSFDTDNRPNKRKQNLNAEVLMQNNSNFGTRKIIFQELEDKKLVLEDWMIDEKNWM